jgi:hypothetical protein
MKYRLRHLRDRYARSARASSPGNVTQMREEIVQMTVEVETGQAHLV